LDRKDVRDANHHPEVIVNGMAGKAPLGVKATVDVPLTLDAAGTRDPDGNTLAYKWFFYPEAGTGIPGQPVVQGPEVPIGGGGVPGEGGIPSRAAGGLRQPPARVTLTNQSSPPVTVTARVAGTAHIILAVEDNGTPTLTSYRRVILTIARK
jgi:hypothetical protein